MASTYNQISSQILTTAASSITFSNIPQTYTDLILVISGTASAQIDLRYTLNSDTGSNYSRTYLVATPASGRDTSLTFLPISYLDTYQTAVIVNFMNYSNTNVYKTILERAGTSIGTNMMVGLWRSTNAISSMTLNTSSGTASIGTTFSLYGIKAA